MTTRSKLGLTLLLGLCLLLPTALSAHIVKSISFTIDDKNVAKCQNVKAKVSFCIKVQKEDLVPGQPQGEAKVKVRLVYDEWGGDSDYEGAQGDVAAVCEKEFKVPFLNANVGADICRDDLFLCSFHASTYDYGIATDPDFYACARSSLNGADNKYSGEIEIEVGNKAGKQKALASLVPVGPPATMVLTASADIPELAIASFTVAYDARTTAVLEAQAAAGFEAVELGPGVWNVSMMEPVAVDAGQPLVTFVTDIDEHSLYGDERAIGGTAMVVSEIEFIDADGELLDTSDLFAFGHDADNDGLPVRLEGDIDGDGVHDDFDAFPLNPTEVADEDEDNMGDSFEAKYFGSPADGLADKDSDGDGLDNLREFQLGLDPTKFDSDGDGVGDGEDAFPTDSLYFQDSDGDLVPDPADAFPDNPGASRDIDGDGLGDSWEEFWFGSRAADPAGDEDGDGIANKEEFLAGSNPILSPQTPAFTGGGEAAGDRTDLLLYPLTVNEEGPVTSSSIQVLGNSNVAVEFGFSEEALASSLKAYWNGVDLAGPDGVRQSGDESFDLVVFDVAAKGFIMRLSGLPLSGGTDELRVQIGSSQDADVLDVDTLRFYSDPTCTFGEEDFHGGLNGYCAKDPDADAESYHLSFMDFAGEEVLSFDWPGPAGQTLKADCDLLCFGGALAVAYRSDRFNLQRPDARGAFGKEPAASSVPAPALPTQAPAKACRLAPNADVEYDNCGGGGQSRCFLACGKGCVGCEVTVGGDCGAAGQSCKTHNFKCYKRQCCVDHDRCLARATTTAAEVACHAQAKLDGCGMDDARGQTHTYTDASCFNPAAACVKVPPPGPKTEACCFKEAEPGSTCQDLSPAECYEAGGTPMGAGTSCNGPDGVAGSGDEPC